METILTPQWLLDKEVHVLMPSFNLFREKEGPDAVCFVCVFSICTVTILLVVLFIQSYDILLDRKIGFVFFCAALCLSAFAVYIIFTF